MSTIDVVNVPSREFLVDDQKVRLFQYLEILQTPISPIYRKTLWKSKRLTTGGYSWEGNMTAMFPSPLYFKLLHTTFLALCTTQIQMFMVTFLTFAFPLFPLCFRLQLGTEQAVVSNNFTILSRLACTWGISGTLYEMRNSWCKGSGTSYDFSWPNPAQVLC